MLRKHSDGEVFRITAARQGLADDVRSRQRRYIISMAVRTVAVVLTAVLWDVQRAVAVVMLVLGFVLPYVAVVIANAGRENAPSLPSVTVPPPARRALTAAGPGSPASQGGGFGASGGVSDARTASAARGNTDAETEAPSGGTPHDRR
ncbi:DUF3099 domain-containing protein [Streptomyces sp. NPDC050560]|uniref:DUF3099 domain-containing protein n=1 Tax=Streptomyces sp. NPDC050560 TaxID=3365630 RepID=UPI0037B0D311